MERCDGPIGGMSISEALNCVWEKGSNALTDVVHSPGSASISNWALALLTILILINVLLLITRILFPRPLSR